MTHAPSRVLDLDDSPDATRSGRHFVRQQVLELGAASVADDAALVAGELLANARQHGDAPVAARVSGDRDRVRLDVSDANPRFPLRPQQNPGSMTGRGLLIIESLATRWGVDRLPDGGKSVWAEFDTHPAAAPAAAADLDALLTDWPEELTTTEQRFTVVLGEVPTDLLIGAKRHIDNVVRELSLASATGDEGLPDHLAGLVQSVVLGFRDARESIKRQALAASARGDSHTTLRLHLPASAADAGEAYLRGLDEADAYSRAARLLTLETPPEHRIFRHWYVGAVVRQLRRLAAGLPAERTETYDERLTQEIRRLSAAARAGDRASRLQRVTAALATAQTPEDVANVVVSEGVAALGAAGGGVLVPAGDGEHLAVPGAVGYGEELVGALREERRDAPLPAATALRTGRAVWLESRLEIDRLFPALRGLESETTSLCAVPLLIGGRAIGALRFSFTTRRLFDDDEREFVRALAAQTAQTLQRTETYEAERKAALDLQRALLPATLPAVPGWEFASFCSPAGDQQAGGDFYDVVPLRDGRLAAFLGDVMGRGVQAAAAMAEIRSTIRAYAIDDPEPARVMSRVDTFFDVVPLEQLVTVLYFLITPAENSIEIANAGHLPPLLVGPDGVSRVESDPGMPFGVGPLPRTTVTVTMSPGSALLAYTDGLVERRDEDLDTGIERLMTVARDARQASGSGLLTRVTALADDLTSDDDVTALVLRRAV